jgi:hypothetical protein
MGGGIVTLTATKSHLAQKRSVHMYACLCAPVCPPPCTHVCIYVCVHTARVCACMCTYIHIRRRKLKLLQPRCFIILAAFPRVPEVGLRESGLVI